MIRSVVAAGVLLVMSSAIADEESAEVAVGRPAPDFIVTGIDGKPFRLSDRLEAGDQHIVLLFSRASW